MVFLGFYRVDQWKAKIKQGSFNSPYIPLPFLLLLSAGLEQVQTETLVILQAHTASDPVPLLTGDRTTFTELGKETTKQPTYVKVLKTKDVQHTNGRMRVAWFDSAVDFADEPFECTGVQVHGHRVSRIVRLEKEQKKTLHSSYATALYGG